MRESERGDGEKRRREARREGARREGEEGGGEERRERSVGKEDIRMQEKDRKKGEESIEVK